MRFSDDCDLSESAAPLLSCERAVSFSILSASFVFCASSASAATGVISLAPRVTDMRDEEESEAGSRTVCWVSISKGATVA